MIIIILTGILGYVLSAVWFLVYGLTFKFRRPDFVYTLLRCVIIGHILIFLYECVFVPGALDDSSNTFMPYVTDTLMIYVTVFEYIWCAGIAIVMVIQVPKLVKFISVCRCRVRAKIIYLEHLDTIREKLGIKRKIRLYIGYGVGTPFIIGILRPTIYLPCDKFSDEELDMILTHELNHYKQGDVFWKPAIFVMCWIFWFDLLLWFMLKQLKSWAEASCDYKCCRDRYSPNKYFSTISQVSERITGYALSLAPMWNEDSQELRWRIACMKKYRKVSLKKRTMALVAVLALGMGSITVCAAANKVEDEYNDLYMDTASMNEEENSYVDGLEEETCTLDGYVIIQEPELPYTTYSGAKNFSKSIPTGSAYLSGLFSASKGGTISVMAVISPSNKTVKVGIVQPDGTIRYVSGSGTIYHPFEVKQSGNHKIVIMNDSGVTVTATGTYSY